MNDRFLVFCVIVLGFGIIFYGAYEALRDGQYMEYSVYIVVL